MPKPNRQKVHYVITEDLLPEMMSVEFAGHFYVAKAEDTVWYVAANGALVSLTDLLQNAKPVAPPRHGRDGKDGVCCCKNGKDGQSIQGPKGDKGECGQSITGPAGRDGVSPPPCTCVNVDADARLSRIETRFSELRDIITRVAGKADAASTATLSLLDSRIAEAKSAVTELSNKQTAFATTSSVADAGAEHAQLKRAVAELTVTMQGLLDANKRGAEYIQFLKDKIARGK